MKLKNAIKSFDKKGVEERLGKQATSKGFRLSALSNSAAKGGELILPNGVIFKYENATDTSLIPELVEDFEKKALLDIKKNKNGSFAGKLSKDDDEKTPDEIIGMEWNNFIFELSANETDKLTDTEKFKIRDAIKDAIAEFAEEKFLFSNKDREKLVKEFLNTELSIKSLIDNIEDSTDVSKKIEELRKSKDILVEKLEALDESLKGKGKVMLMIDNFHKDAGKEHIQFRLHKYIMDVDSKNYGGSIDQSIELHKISSLDQFTEKLNEKINALNIQNLIKDPVENSQTTKKQFTENDIRSDMKVEKHVEEKEDIDNKFKNGELQSFSPELSNIIDGKNQAINDVKNIDMQIEKLQLRRDVAEKYAKNAIHAEEAIKLKDIAVNEKNNAISERDFAIDEKNNAVTEKDIAEKELKEEQQKVESYSVKNNELVTELETKKEKITEVIEEKDILEAEKDEIISSKDDDIENKNNLINDLDAERNALVSQLSTVNKEKDGLSKELENEKNENSGLSEKLVITKENLEKSDSEKVILKTDLTKLSDKLEESEEIKKGLESTMTTQAKDLGESEKNNVRLVSENSSLKSENFDLNKKNAELENNLSGLSQKMQKMQAQMIENQNKSMQQNADLVTQNADLVTQNTAIMEQLKQLSIQMTSISVANAATKEKDSDDKSQFVEALKNIDKPEISKEDEADILKALDEQQAKADQEKDNKGKGKDDSENDR